MSAPADRAAAGAGVVAGSTSCSAGEVSLRALALLRVLVGPIVLLHLAPFLSDSLHGRIYQDVFHEPYASWYPELPEGAYIGVLWLGAAAAVAMSSALASRRAGHGHDVRGRGLQPVPLHHPLPQQPRVPRDRARVLAMAPCGRECARRGVAARRGSHRSTAPAWPLWLLRFECAAVYGASGLSKLLDPDWFGGTVTWQRVVHARADLHRAAGLGGVAPHRPRASTPARPRRSSLTELFIALGLWSRRTRYAAVWVAAVFHLTIEASASVQVFSFLGIGVLLIWAVPSTRDRVLRVDPARAAVACGARARLAGALPARAGAARTGRRGGGPRRHRRSAAGPRWRSRSAGCR